MGGAVTTRVAWAAQPGPQSALLACPVFEVFYGGARGGGKTDGMLGEWAVHADKYGEGAAGVFFRRELTQLEEAIERSRQIYAPLGAEWHDQRKTWRFPGGARLKFRYLDRDSDAEKYQGHSYSRVYIEEICNFPDPGPILKLMATLRSGSGVPCRFRATGNPGGPGHAWVKARYIDPAPAGFTLIRDPVSGLERVYIPSRVSDNRLLMDHDPGYVDRLRAAGSASLVRAWLEGDWSVVEGAYFDDWSAARHVIRPIPLPAHWVRFRAMDWGSYRPFSVGWYAVSDGTLPGIAKGALVRYREWYGASAPNVGLKLAADEVAAGILAREVGDKIDYGVCDPAMFASDGGPSLAERMGKAGVRWRPADNKRLAGWDQVRSRLKGDGDGAPLLLVFATCTDLIRTLPALQHDRVRPEDLDSDAEDHAADELRYGCMSRPWERVVPPSPGDPWAIPTAGQIFDLAIKGRGERDRI